MTIKARVRAGRLVVDEPTKLSPKEPKWNFCLSILATGSMKLTVLHFTKPSANQMPMSPLIASSTPKRFSGTSVHVDPAPGQIHGNGPPTRST